MGQGRTVYIKEAGGVGNSSFEHPSVLSSFFLIYISTAISYIVALSSPLPELPTTSTYFRRSTSLTVGTTVPYPIDRTRQVFFNSIFLFDRFSQWSAPGTLSTELSHCQSLSVTRPARSFVFVGAFVHRLDVLQLIICGAHREGV